MNEFHDYALGKFKNILDFFPYLLKFMIGGGVFGLILYFMKIDYYPLGLSITDTLNLIIISISFGLVYVLLLICSYSGGFFIYYIIYSFIIIFNKEKRKICLINLQLFLVREERGSIFITPLINTFYILFLIFLSLFFVFFYNFEWYAILLFLVSGLGTYLLLKVFYDELNGANNYGYKGKLILLKGTKDSFKKESLKAKNKNLLALLLVGIFMPLIGYLYDEGNSRLLFVSVKQFTVFHDKKTIFVDKKFSSRIPAENIETEGQQDKDYFKLKNTNILLLGLGKNAWVEFLIEDKDKDKDKDNKRVEIPNDAIYIGSFEDIKKNTAPN